MHWPPPARGGLPPRAWLSRENLGDIDNTCWNQPGGSPGCVGFEWLKCTEFAVRSRLALGMLSDPASTLNARLGAWRPEPYTGGMASDKDPNAVLQPNYPVACYPVAPPPRGEDLPYDDGVPMESERHFLQMVLLIMSLKLGWKDRNDFYVGGNMFVYFSELQSKKNDFRGPDVFVVLDTVTKERKSWVVWEEAGRTPDVVIELTSPSPEHVDRGHKKRIYAQILRVPEYYLFDPFETRFDGYALDGARGEYVPMPVDDRGWIRSKKLGLWLGPVRSSYQGIEIDWLRWIDDDGRMLPTEAELDDQSYEERDQAQLERDQVQRERDQVQRERDKAQLERDKAQQLLREAAQRLVDQGMAPEQVAAILGVDVTQVTTRS